MGLFDYVAKASTKPESFFDRKTSGIDMQDTAKMPGDGFISKSKDSETVLNEKLTLITYRNLWNLTRISDILQSIFNTRARKTFRQGFEISPTFEAAPQEQEKSINKWLKKCNDNNQSLKEVFVELDKDLNWADDAYLLAMKDYGYNKAGKIVVAETKGFMRLHPLVVKLVLDRNNRLGYFYDESNNRGRAYFSPLCRNALVSDKYDKDGRENLRAHYEVISNDGSLYYSSDEIMHKSAFNPSLTYGYSPLFSLYQKVLILMLQDSYIKKYYGDDKPTKGLLVFNTSNKQALMKTFEEIRQKTQQNPHGVKPIIAESSDGRKPVEYIDMAKTLDEMQYTGTREEIRQQIGAMYGVSNMFQNDMSQGGGLNNEGLQITVTNEVIQDRQDLFNNYFLDFVFKQNLGFYDWDVEVRPDVEQDLMAEEQLEAQRLSNVKVKLELGLEGRRDKNGEFIFREGDLKLEEPQQDFLPFGKSSNKTIDASNGIVEKASDKAIDTEEQKFNSKLDDELKSILDDLDFNKIPEKKTLTSKLKDITDLIEKKLKRTASNIFKGIYERFAKETSKEIGEKFTMTNEDKEVVSKLKNDPLYQEAFKNMSDELSDNVRSIIKDSFGKPDFTIDKLTEQLKEATDQSKAKVRTIARTETVKLGIAAQNKQLEKTGNKYVYTHIGAKDNRTGEDSKEMMKLTAKGVSWDEYVKIAKQVANRFNPKWKVNEVAPILHPNQRSKPLFRRVEQ